VSDHQDTGEIVLNCVDRLNKPLPPFRVLTAKSFVDDERLHQSLRVTFVYVVVGVPLQLLLALGVAILLDKGMRGTAVYRSIFYLPSMLGASVAIARNSSALRAR